MTRENTDAAPLHEGEGEELERQIASEIAATFEGGGGAASGHDFEWDGDEADALAKTAAATILKLIASARSAHEGEGEPVAGLHPATSDLVDRFSQALKEKLARAEAKYGYSDGWLSTDWHDDLVRDLAHHVQKGDPRDVAAYCAFAWHHGWSTTPPPSVEVFGSSSLKGEDTHRVAETAVLDWKEAATGLCAEVLKQAPVQIEKISDLLYEGLLNDVQAYLRENVDYNLSSELRRAKSDATRANNALQSVAINLGVDTHGFPNFPTPEMVEDQCAIAFAKLEAKATTTSTAEQAGTSVASEPNPSVEVEGLRDALERFLWWGQQQCPCDNDEPNPCPLCGASIENLEGCKAIEAKFPRDILTQARSALSRKQEPGAPTPGAWIEWSGGPNPVPGQNAEVKLRSGDCFTGSDLSPDATWQHIWGEADIIAYRIVPTPGGEGE